jgi:integrase
MIHSNPCQHVKLPRSPKEQQIILTPEEISKLANQLQNPANQRTEQYSVMVLVAAYTGLRAGELLALRRSDVDLLRGKLTISRALKDIHGRFSSAEQKGMLFGPTKSHATRTVQLPKFLTAILNDYLSHPLPSGSSPEALIFPDTNGGPLRHNNFYRRQFKPAVLRALPPEKQAFTFHCLRHTCASLLIEQGVHARAIQEQLGHSSILVTMGTYGHLMDSAYQSTASALDAAYQASQQPQDNVIELRQAESSS